MGRGLSFILGIVAIGFLVLWTAMYGVDQVNYALVMQFGEIRQVRSNPGLYFKVPMIQQVTYLDRRILTSDTVEEEYLTSDQKRIVVNQVTRWRISDPTRFFLSHNLENAGRNALERVVLGTLKDQIAERPYDVMISANRDAIMDIVRDKVQNRVDDERWGITVIDVRTKRADLPSAVELTVYQRMASARQVEAGRHRAQGQLASDEITAQTDREVKVMLACADRVSQEIRGAGEAAAVGIFGDALKQDPEFYSFLRRLEAYSASFKSEDQLVMSTASNFFRLLSGDVVPVMITESTKGPIERSTLDDTLPLTQKEVEELIRVCTPSLGEEGSQEVFVE